MSAYHSYTDAELTGLLKSGDERAFERLYRVYSLPILKKLIRLVKDEVLAEELLQDVFLKIWEGRENIDPERSFRAYLYRIAQNLVTDLFRRAANDRKLMAHLINASTELYHPFVEKENEAEIRSLLQTAIDILPPQRRKIYTLCKVEGKTYEEVSVLLGISTSTISDHIVKATKMLNKYGSSHEIAMILVTAATIAAVNNFF